MCSSCVLYSIFAALAATLFISGIGVQIENKGNIGLDSDTGLLAVQYFAAFFLFGAAKYYKSKICCVVGGEETKKTSSTPRKSKSRRRRR